MDAQRPCHSTRHDTNIVGTKEAIMNTFVHHLPLGIRPQVALSTEQRRKLCTLEAYDLSAVRHRILVEGMLPHALVDEAIFEFRRFLALNLVLGRPVGMSSKQVDQVWHACLLFSRLYADLCQQVFGQFVHHEPAGHEPMAAEMGAAVADARSEVQVFEEAYARIFGPLGRLWQWDEVITPDHAAAALSAKLTELAQTLSPSELNALEQFLALAARGYEASQAEAPAVSAA
jgi:hypothetical protein